VLPERPRARRYTFPANIELIHVESEAKIREQTCDLNLFGCRVRTTSPWAVGSKVRLRISYKGANFVALGRVANVMDASMGVEFSDVRDKDQCVLENGWRNCGRRRKSTRECLATEEQEPPQGPDCKAKLGHPQGKPNH
jgi:hypothetical protein